jgi:hypothetical protein
MPPPAHIVPVKVNSLDGAFGIALKDHSGSSSTLATFRRKNARSDPGRLTLHAADMVFGGDFALVRSRARSEWTLPA